MIRILKSWLLWLLIAALPVQGFAAAAMAMFCDTAGHGEARVVAMMPDGHHHQDRHAAGFRHVVERTVHSGGHLMAAAPDAAPVNKVLDAHHHGNSLCSVCAACCVGAVAPPSTMVWPSVSMQPQTILIIPVTSTADFIPDGIERPPRPISI